MHPIIIYISCPRSYSVTITRVMEQSGHFNIRHEPYSSVHLKKYYPQALNSWCRRTCYKTSSKIKKDIFRMALEKPVFVKEMALSIYDFIIDDLEFISNPNVHFIFAYRHPRDVIHSMYDRCEDIVHQNVGVFTQIMGYDKLIKLYEKIRPQNKNTLLLNMNDLYSAIHKLYDFVQIKYDEGDFIWETCDTDEKLEQKSISWRENKVLPIFKHWHNTALMSSGIKLEKRTYNSINDEPTFKEIVENHRTNIAACYRECMTFYRHLEQLNK